MTQIELYHHLLANYYYHTDGQLRRLSDHKAVGTVATSANPYLRHKIENKAYYVHRLIYLLVHGHYPKKGWVDHIDRNRLNNKIENLRGATPAENAWNRSKNSNNTTGVKGIFMTRNGKYKAMVARHYLGTYDDVISAVQARVNFTERHHHEYACHG